MKQRLNDPRRVLAFLAPTLLIIMGACGDDGDDTPAPGPGTPTGVYATAGDGAISIHWDPVPGATSYNLYCATATGVDKVTGNRLSSRISPHFHTGLTNGVTYYYVVTALSGAQEGAESNEASAIPSSTVGTLDTSFAGTGWITHNGAAGGNSTDRGEAVVVDARGRILVAGSSESTPLDLDMVIWRFEEDGTPDLSFGSQGWIVHGGAAGGTGNDVGADIVVDTSDRIVVTGASRSSGGDSDMVLWRYWDDGTPDTTFGIGGVAVHNDAAGGGGSDGGIGVALDPAGRIIVVGTSDSGTDDDMVVWCFEPDGDLDTSFSGQGWVVHDNAAGGAGHDFGRGVVLDAAGRILVAGSSFNASGNADLAVWAYLPSGSLDTAFGTGGVFVHDAGAGGGADDEGFGIALDCSGRILVTGHSWSPVNIDMTIWRLTSSGNLDPTFGSGGVVWHDNAAGGSSHDYGSAISLDLFGNVYAAGSGFSGTSADMVIWRYSSGGGLDSSFAGQGWVVHHDAAGGDGDDVARDATVNLLGRILATGWSVNAAGDSDMVVWRYR